MKIDILKKEMDSRNVSVIDLASALDVDKATIYRKFNGTSPSFTSDDIRVIAKVLKLSKPKVFNIFLSD